MRAADGGRSHPRGEQCHLSPPGHAPLLSLLAALALSAPADKPDPKKSGWFTDYPTAQAEAKRTGKPIMLVFRCDP